MLDPMTGVITNVNVPIDQATGRKLWDVTLGGGDAIVFKFNDGAPFIVPEPGMVGVIMAGLMMMQRLSRGQ